MPATGSTRTATPWRWSEPIVRGALSLLLLSSACVTRTSHEYLPSADRDRLSVNAAQDELDQLMQIECARLLSDRRPESGEARLSIDLDATGAVSRSRVTASTGDERVDNMFGAVAAQMMFEAPPDGKPTMGRMRMGYSCSPTATTVTIQLR